MTKNGMTCYVCADKSGRTKEECMSHDPNNNRMEYHEVSEYSSLPPAAILPVPNSQDTAASQVASTVASSPESSGKSSAKKEENSSVEEKLDDSKVKNKRSVSVDDFDFDY